MWKIFIVGLGAANGLTTKTDYMCGGLEVWIEASLDICVRSLVCWVCVLLTSPTFIHILLCFSLCFSSNIQTLMGVDEVGVGILPKDILACRLDSQGSNRQTWPALSPELQQQTGLFCLLNYEEWVILWSATCRPYLFLARRKINCIPTLLTLIPVYLLLLLHCRSHLHLDTDSAPLWSVFELY